MGNHEMIRVSHRRGDSIYTVWYTDDSPERKEAIQFFQANTAGLVPATTIPSLVQVMPIHKANSYLQLHRQQKRWGLLQVMQDDPIADDDLARLRFLPELKQIRIYADISDEGVRHLLRLRTLEGLVLHSSRVTDKCLDFIRWMPSLRQVDLRGSPGISRRAFYEAMRSMTVTPEMYPPQTSIV